MAELPEALLTNSEMAQADAFAVKSGVPSLTLMENAGAAVAGEIMRRFTPRSVCVLTGPGNNGGDGWVVARHLKERGWDVWVEWLTPPSALKGDAAEMAKRFKGAAGPINAQGRDPRLFVDALFGAGITRALEGDAKRLAEESVQFGKRVVSIDVPSGLDGTTGEPAGGRSAPCFHAGLTVTFFRKKPGHLLMPGRARCGEVVVSPIGIPVEALEEIKPTAWINSQSLWGKIFPQPASDAHKYTRGHTVVVSGGPWATGAARLAARGALRVGSGLVTVASPVEAMPVNAGHLTAIMLARADDGAGLAAVLSDVRKNAVVIGPGNGVSGETARKVEAALKSSAAVVLDADALTSFKDMPEMLFALCRDKVVMTPHEGEFARLFPDVLDASPRPGRLEAARIAATRANAVIVLKGADTVIAAPPVGGADLGQTARAAINDNAPPDLATAGSGDVLSGMIGGLLAQGMPAFEAACAGVWLHGAAAARIGRGLIAEDLPEALPAVLRAL
ncbi:MAG TPA: NAD(P)H-hydrate dehydratase [Alphaproteobacteria bacterium]|nr:NAD(P)H-hydrate dehydratase [Alphaproteobacteria bacterium]